MGIGSKRPPLPAPTDSSTENLSSLESTDIATNLSQQTIKSSYSIPEDGSPLILPYKKTRPEKSILGRSKSQDSLLIEYFEAGKLREGKNPRPSVRARVTPHGKKLKSGGNLDNSGSVKLQKPSYKKRISLEGRTIPKSARQGRAVHNRSISLPHSSAEAATMENQSDLSANHPSQTAYVAPPSDISSMPADSMLDGPAKIKSPMKNANSTPGNTQQQTTGQNENLKAPSVQRSRSKSTERITRKAIEKLTRETSPDDAGVNRRSYKSGTTRGEEDLKPRSRRSSKSHRDSATDSSVIPHRDAESNLSAASKYSLNNPKLLNTVEEIVRRILPEIETMKRHRSVRSSGTRDSFASESTFSRTDPDAKSHRTSRGQAKDVRDHEDSEHGDIVGKRKHRRRSSQNSAGSEKASSRRESVDSIAEEKERIRRHKENGKARAHEKEKSHSPRKLTKANLKSHTSRSSVDSLESHGKERRRRRGESKSKSQSRSDEKSTPQEIPPMPMNSEIQDSDLTRESILSADTTESPHEAERPQSSLSKTAGASTRDIASPVSRATEKQHSAKSSRGDSPLTVRSRGDKSLASPRSDRSLGSTRNRTAALAGAGLGGAAGAMYGYHERRDRRRSRSKDSHRTRSRDASPTRQFSGTRQASQTKLRENEKATAQTPPGRPANTNGSDGKKGQSMESMQSSESVNYPMTQKRHQGVNLEKDSDIIDDLSGLDQDDVQDEDHERFFERQHEINDRYRSSADYEDQQETLEALRTVGEHSFKHSPDAPSFGRAAAGQEVQGVGANPEVVHTSHQAESAVASLLYPSTVNSDQSAQPGLNHKPEVSPLDETHEAQKEGQEPVHQKPWLGAHENSSAERWNAIRGHAQRLSNSSPTKGQSTSGHEIQSSSDTSENRVRMGKSGLPIADDPMPEIGHGFDERSEGELNASPERKKSSIIEGPLGDQSENQGTWPYEPTPPIDQRRGYAGSNGQDDHATGSRDAAIIGAAAGLGIGGVATQLAAAKQSQPSLRQERSQSSADQFEYGELPDGNHYNTHVTMQPPSPNNMKDEGYVSAAQPDGASPLSLSKPPPRLFDESHQPHYDPAVTGRDPFVNDRNVRMSGDSYGDTYDAATGAGINNIQSKDVVALMDHLTVRDGQRNARDTEILVTLVRSAAEMRTSFEDMKKFIETQNRFNINQSDQQADRTVNKIMNGTRGGGAGSRGLQSASTSDRDDVPSKRKNIFKRALSGLSSKNEKDLTKIEEMLMQLLDEVEGLRDAQSVGMSQGRGPMSHAQPSLDSYERLRAAPESGYEPEGQAGTSSTANQSGNLSTQSPYSRSTQRMHSGYDVRGHSANRISTVPEADERMTDDPRYENDDGMLTPTQEAQKHRAEQYETPTSGSRGVPSTAFTSNTPRASDDRYKQRSAGSSLFGGIPKISRWSKTTTSSGPPERSSYQHDRPYSEVSRSGSSVNVIPDDDSPYKQHEDDRLPSSNYHARDRDHERSPSPLLPDGSNRSSMEDPKYRANRQSLTLQHPQPRQGSTIRHRSHLESQASAFGGQDNRSNNSLSDIAQPDIDAFGSAPSLARNRPIGLTQNQHSSGFTNQNYQSPRSSNGRYNNAPPRPPKIKDDSPLVPSGPPLPPKVPQDPAHDQQRNSSSSIPDSAGGDSYDSLEQEQQSRDSWSQEELDSPEYDYDDGGGGGEGIEPIPLSRKQSPYQAGGLLAPIEERYSLEQARSTISTPAVDRGSVRGSVRGAGGQRLSYGEEREREREKRMKEFDEEDRADTPTQSPRVTMQARAQTATAEQGRVVSGARKVSGPRDMPRPASDGSRATVAGAGQSAPLMGTVRRKPARPGDY